MTNNDVNMPAGADGAHAGPSGSERRQGLLGLTRDLALASIGIVGVLRDEAQALYARSLERGEGEVRRVQDRLRLPRSSRRKTRRAGEGRTWIPQPVSDELRTALIRLNIPSAAEVDALSWQVSELEAKIAQLTDES